MYFSENLETCTIGWVLICEDGVGVGNESAFFILVGGDGAHLPHPRRFLYTPPVHPCPLQRTRNDCARQTVKQTMQGTTHARTLDTLHQSAIATRQATRVDQDFAGRWRAWNVSETEQICTHSNMNDFQHKNVCKTVDINTRTCYYIDNTRTCYTTTKQEDKNHEN